MKKRKTVKDECNEKRVELKEYYNSNPSLMRLKEAFDLRCKKCGGKYIAIGITWYGKVGDGIKVGRKRYQVAAPNMHCIECHNLSTSVALARTDKGLALVTRKQEEEK